MATADNGTVVTASTDATAITLDEGARVIDIYNIGAQDLLIKVEGVTGDQFASIAEGQALQFRRRGGIIPSFTHKTAASTTTFYWSVTEVE